MAVTIRTLILGGLLLAAPLSPLPAQGRGQARSAFSVENGLLLRGDDGFQLRAVPAPSLSDPDRGLEEKIRFLNETCSAGGNTVLLSLPPWNCSGREIGRDWLEAFRMLNQEVRKRTMGILLRIPMACDPTSPEAANMASMLARDFARSRDVIFWFDGPQAALLESQFRRETRRLVSALATGTRRLRLGAPQDAVEVPLDPETLPADGHFCLTDPKDALERLDKQFGETRVARPLPKDGEGFFRLLDSKTLENAWEVSGDPAGWSLEDGILSWKQPGGGKVRTRQRFADFELRLEWRIDKGGNSGLFLRAPAAGRESRIGIELQLSGDHQEDPHIHGTGAIYDVLPPRLNASLPSGEWNDLRVECRGSRLRAWLNGKEIHDVDLDADPELRLRLKRGFIGLQDHGTPVAFRNVRVRELGVGS